MWKNSSKTKRYDMLLQRSLEIIVVRIGKRRPLYLENIYCSYALPQTNMNACIICINNCISVSLAMLESSDYDPQGAHSLSLKANQESW